MSVSVRLCEHMHCVTTDDVAPRSRPAVCTDYDATFELDCHYRSLYTRFG
jgi:hypothetical protein